MCHAPSGHAPSDHAPVATCTVIRDESVKRDVLGAVAYLLTY